MKLSKLFHWLYASLMFLPLLVIPIFALYTRNEANTFENNIVLEVEENKVVDFNQLITIKENPYYTYNGNDLTFSDSTFPYVPNFATVNNIYGHKVLFYYVPTTTIDNPSSSTYFIYFNNNGIYEGINYVTNYCYTTINVQQVNLEIRLNAENMLNKTISICFIDLTQMFGSGNEPSYTQFKDWYPLVDYDFTLSEKQLLKNYSVEILNNTDIGSQFLYSVYKPVNDYFNIKDWMNLGGLYDWFLLNIFNGSNSIVIPIIFNLIIYWLVVSFIWLIFDVLMYVPNMIHKMLDKARME